MKIALISHHFPPNFRGGAEQYAYRIAQGLRRQGHNVEVVCVESITSGMLTPTAKTDTFDGLTIHRLFYDLAQAPNRFEWSFRHPELGCWVKNFLQQTRPDVVHINSGYILGGKVIEAARELNLPTVLTLHDYWFLCPQITLLRQDGHICHQPVSPARCVWCAISEKRRYRLIDTQLNGKIGDAFSRLSQADWFSQLLGLQPRLELMAERRAYLKRVLEEIDIVISPSRFLIDKVEEYGFKPRQMVYLPFGIDTAHLAAPPAAAAAPKKLRIGYLGQLVPHKGVHLLLDAFKMLARQPGACELILHGKISEATAYERQLLKMGEADPDITFAGPYPNTEVGRVLNELDVIVVPSIWYENRPTVIIEAMATRTPAVVARLGGMAELVKHNHNGLLFDSGNVTSLAAQLQRLLNEPTLLAQLRQNIPPIPKAEDELNTIVSLYQSLVKQTV